MSRRMHWTVDGPQVTFPSPTLPVKAGRRPAVRWTIAPGFVRVAAFGSASRDDVVAAIGAATRASGFVRGMGLLLDGRAMTSDTGASLSHDDLRQRASGMAALGFGRCALIAAVDTPAREGSGSAAPPVASYGLPTAIFSEPTNAERWLLSYTRD